MKKKRGKILFYFNFLRDGIQWNMLKIIRNNWKKSVLYVQKEFSLVFNHLNEIL